MLKCSAHRSVKHAWWAGLDYVDTGHCTSCIYLQTHPDCAVVGIIAARERRFNAIDELDFPSDRASGSHSGCGGRGGTGRLCCCRRGNRGVR